MLELNKKFGFDVIERKMRDTGLEKIILEKKLSENTKKAFT